ncbi:hypothetical protein Catovirus_1_871 [Catovirus CTV1]|uniref:Uncharacterized protein n=1 Tax=Catovirus CTV1 TaxID=1977631 RepID=A0A1V0SAW0_9VIRU|nr:hypothetical protein Catovirus_1_871 [Catovirus CTV1]
MSTVSTKTSNSPHWDKIFKRANKHKKNSFSLLTQTSLNSCSSNVTKDNDSTCDLNFSKLQILKNENNNFIKNTETIIKLAEETYSESLSEFSDLRSRLTDFNDNLKTQEENEELYDQFKKEYDDILDAFYQKLIIILKKRDYNNGEKISALFEICQGNIERKISLSYIASGGVVMNDCIAKIDNVLLENKENKIIFVIGKRKFKIKKSGGIKEFTFEKMIDKITKIISKLLEIEKEVEKNIKILSYAEDTIQAVKNNLN